MTLVAIFVPLLAWATVAWGVGFLPLLGLANATSILLEGLNPLGESVAVLAVCFGVIPTIFLLRYQLETHYERSRLNVVFLALVFIILLVLIRVQMDAQMGVQLGTQIKTTKGVGAFFPGMCTLMIGLVAVMGYRGIVWQWLGLQISVQGLLFMAVVVQKSVFVGIVGFVGVVVLVQGILCIHRILPRTSVLMEGYGERNREYNIIFDRDERNKR